MSMPSGSPCTPTSLSIPLTSVNRVAHQDRARSGRATETEEPGGAVSSTVKAWLLRRTHDYGWAVGGQWRTALGHRVS
jgi:hypothetical protein